MIPVADIEPANLYSQEDAELLLGDGFTRKAAREIIGEACRTGQLESRKWKGRHWFVGRTFLAWVEAWFGAGLEIPAADPDPGLAKPLSIAHHGPATQGPARPAGRGGG